MLSAGIDAGMRFAKMCILYDGEIVASRSFAMDGHFRRKYKEVLKGELVSLRESGVSRGKLRRITATGYGASLIPGVCFHVSEGSCIAAAAGRSTFPVRTVIDAGGIFIKIHRINERGYFSGTVKNDKCAAGSGRLLEITADALKLPLETLSSLDLSSAEPYQISSSCAVFAESELISQIGNGIASNDILAGVIRSLAAKTAALLENSRGKDPVAITGGLSSVNAFIEVLKEITGREIIILPGGPQMSSALGAALLGQDIKIGWALRTAGNAALRWRLK